MTRQTDILRSIILQRSLDYGNRLAKVGQAEMRALIIELHPESLRTDGLVAALEKHAVVLTLGTGSPYDWISIRSLISHWQ